MVFFVVLSLAFTVQVLSLDPPITPQEFCNIQNSNVQGKLVYLNYWVDSVYLTVEPGYIYYGYAGRETIDSPEECCHACSDQPSWDKCNAWSYCDNPDGCGEGCADYMAQWKKAVNDGDDAWVDKHAPKIYTDESREMDWQCGDKWPYKTCSLKYVEDVDNAKQVTQGQAAKGWKSGLALKDSDYPSWMCQNDVPDACCDGPYPPKYECANGWCGAVQANLIGAELITLDVDSGVYHRYEGPSGDTPETCCQICQSDDECEAWTYCNREEGCGSGCEETIQAIHEADVFKPRLETSCTDNNAFPFRLCSKKKISGTDYKMDSKGTDNEGWVSGILLPLP
eukprot:TRINITY_DN1297_c0_g1_i1.p1 TRINITY_DN1297_c0_g1~~TRINITY_DN1297_c0_g1_i1.p1  ORF type:complete len:339 (-),score=44.05 TRINITY_DN1297_c0_g1_i1:223-1239(-)